MMEANEIFFILIDVYRQSKARMFDKLCELKLIIIPRADGFESLSQEPKDSSHGSESWDSDDLAA